MRAILANKTKISKNISKNISISSVFCTAYAVLLAIGQIIPLGKPEVIVDIELEVRRELLIRLRRCAAFKYRTLSI